MSGTKLTIELIPSTAWFKNLRHVVGQSAWDRIRRDCYQKADHRCEICGGKGRKWPVECHEIWEFRDNKIILQGLVALCPSCHEVKHIGLASVRGRLPQARRHLMKVNNISMDEANRQINEAFDLFHQRSQEDWELDFAYLDPYINV